MRYLTAEELKESNKEKAREILKKHVGKNIRDFFALEVFENYYQIFFSHDKNKKILDLGTASGEFGSQIHERGYKNIFGVDIDDYILPENKPLFQEFKTADLSWEKIPWPDNSFSVITAWCVLPHLENPFHCIRETHRVLEKNGIFIFTAPCLTSKPSIDYFIRNKDFGSYRGSNNHLILFTKGIVEKAILKYFYLIETEYRFRPKIFQKNGIKGKIRKILYKSAEKISPLLRKNLEERWAYNAFYILKNK